MSRLVLTLLGGFAATLNETTPRFESDKVRALLAYLALESDRPHARDELTTLLWAERPDAAARANLRQALANLQRGIANQTADPPFLLIARDEIQFNAATSNAEVDALQFLALLQEVADHPHRSVEACLACIGRLERAVALYRGELLAHFYLDDTPPFEEWLLVAREEMLRHLMTALGQVAAHYEQRGKEGWDAALVYARRQVELEPWREEPYRTLMRVLAAQGKVDLALAQFQAAAEVLQKELGVEPSVETRALYKHLRAMRSDGTATVSPAGTGERVLTSLPLPTTPLVGRAHELAQLTELFAQRNVRLVTLLGMGGIGKTRLALQFARSQQGAFPRGVYFIDLAAISAPELIPTAIAEALQVTFQGIHSPAAQIVSHLRGLDGDLLLVMDNFEHVIRGAGLLDTLLTQIPHVTLLVTSRERLNLQGEWLFQVEGLSAPSNIPDALPNNWDEPDAVQLFLQCAARAGVAPNAWGEQDRRATLQLTQLVEGMPLAIELAAAWVRAMSPVEIADELQRGLDVLATTQRNVPRRHASIRTVFEHSWELLTAQEQNVFARLSVFRSGMTRDAAHAVAGGSLTILSALIDKSLVKRTAAGRFRLHELVRQFAAEKLALSEGEGLTLTKEKGPTSPPPTRGQHTRYYLDVLARYGAQLNGSQARWALDNLRNELENIRAAWQSAVARADVPELVRALPFLSEFYLVAGLAQEGELLFRQTIHLLESEPSSSLAETPTRQVVARLYAYLALFLNQMGNYVEGAQQAQTAVQRGQAVIDLPGQAIAEEQWGITLYRQVQFPNAREHLERAMTLAREANLPALEASAQLWFGNVLESEAAYDAAEQAERNALDIAESIGDQRLASRALSDLARLANRQFRYARAIEDLERALALKRLVGDPYGEARVLLNLGVSAWVQTPDRTLYYFGQALNLVQEIGDRAGIGQILVNHAEASLWMGEYAHARREFEDALTIGRELNLGWVELSALWGLGMIHYLTAANAVAAPYAQEYLERTRAAAMREEEGRGYILVGHIALGQQDFDRAAHAYQTAATIFREIGHTGYALQATGGLAALSLAQGNLSQALAYAEELISQFDIIAPLLDIEPFRIFLTCYHIFHAASDPRAGEILQRANALLQARAAAIEDADTRTSFLENIPWHREIQRAYKS